MTKLRSIVIAYSHCINHGIDMQKGLSQQKTMVEGGRGPSTATTPA